jgi:hypothetical protein
MDILVIPDGAPICCCGDPPPPQSSCGCAQFAQGTRPNLRMTVTYDCDAMATQVIDLYTTGQEVDCQWQTSPGHSGDPISIACIKCVGDAGTYEDYELVINDISCCPTFPQQLLATGGTCSNQDGKMELEFDFELESDDDDGMCPSGCGYFCDYPVACHAVVREI